MKRLYKFLLFFFSILLILIIAGVFFIKQVSFQVEAWESSESKERTKIPDTPNILLLVAEDLSAHIGAFGDAVVSTPNIDRLAKLGVRYPNTFTTAGVCAPSRAALITGMHQISMGGQHMRTGTRPEGAYTCVPPIEVKAFPELLRKAGYFTFNTSKQDYQFSGAFSGSGPFTIWDEENNADLWRSREDGQAFFGMINFMETHESKLFTPLGHKPHSLTHFLMQVFGELTAPNDMERTRIPPERVPLPPYYPDSKIVRTDIARHYENISIMDALVGRILDNLEKDHLLENTILIWTTDHGDGLPRAKRELYDSGIKVPMIIYYPPAFRPSHLEPGTVDKKLISFVDLAPTILSLAKAPIPDFIQGQNLLHPDFHRPYIYASRDRIDEVRDRQRAVRTKRFKYIKSWFPEQTGGHRLNFRDNIEMMRELWELKSLGKLNEDQLIWFQSPGEERLFDLENDPFELQDVSKDISYVLVMDTMRAALGNWLASIEDWSDQPENEMVRQFQADDKTKQTPAPTFKQDGEYLEIEAIPGASIGYQIGDNRWKLYAQPLPISSINSIKSKAIRYGWEESEEIEFVKH